MQFHGISPYTAKISVVPVTLRPGTFLTIAILAVLLISSAALSATVTWTGAGDGSNWTDKDNWSNGKLPGAADDVTIPAGKTVTAQLLYGYATVKSLTCPGHLRVVEKPYHYYGVVVTGQAAVNQLIVEGARVSFEGDTTVSQLLVVSGVNGGSASFSGQASLGTVDLQGGIFSYSSSKSNPPTDVTIDTLTISSGQIIAGGWARKLIVNTLFEIKGAGDKFFELPATSLVNKNQANWSGTGNIEFQGAFRNEAGATTTLEEDLTFRPHNTVVYNAGTFQKAGGTGVTTLPGEFNSEGGTIDVQSGTLELAAETGTHQAGVPEGGVWNGGTVNVGSGAKLILVRDTYTWNGTVQGVIEGSGAFEGHFQLGKGGSDSCSVVAGVGGATVNFSGNGIEVVQGYLSGYASGMPLVNKGLVDFAGAGTSGIVGLFDNQATLRWTGTGPIDLTGELRNSVGGYVDIVGGTRLYSQQNSGYMENYGVVGVGNPSGTVATTFEIPFNNRSGVVRLSAGTLNLAGGGVNSGGSASSGGEFMVNGSSSVLVISGDAVYTNQGYLALRGSGLVRLECTLENVLGGHLGMYPDSPSKSLLRLEGTAGEIYNRGTLSVGGIIEGPSGSITNAGVLHIGLFSGPGALWLEGNFSQLADGTLEVELAGAMIDKYDQLDVAGDCRLSGTLNVSRIYSFEPEGDDQFLVLKCGSRTRITRVGENEFTTINGLDLDGGKLQPTWDPPGLPADRQAGLLLTTVTTGFVVNTTGDESDADGSDGLCDVDLQKPGLQCTLRAALEEVNRQPGKTYVTFAIPATDPQFDQIGGIAQIRPASALPTVIVPVSINGLSQPGMRPPGTPGIWLDGFNSGGGGLAITAGSSTIRGLIICRFADDGLLLKDLGGNIVSDCEIGTDGTNRLGNTLSGVHLLNSGQNTITSCLVSANLFAGVFIEGNGSTGNKVTKCTIGLGLLNVAGLGLSNVVFSGSGSAPAAGVLIRDAGNNTIGGAAGDGNIIGGNERGVVISGSSAATAAATSQNHVSHNWIGTDMQDATDIGNNQEGVSLAYAQKNVISDNIISGNGGAGVAIRGSDTDGNRLEGNFIGLSTAGDEALPNQGDGVRVEDCPDGVTIGDLNGLKGNVLSGNKGHGVHVINGVDVLIAGNIIGVGTAGAKDVGNQGYGVLIEGVSQNVLVGVEGAGNVISGNARYGVALVGNKVTGNTVQSNSIGTNAAGNQAIENLVGGILLQGASQNVIGGQTEAERNLISGNHFWGVNIEGETARENLVQGNFIGVNRIGSAALANGAGVRVNGAPANVIGGNESGQGNVISGNTTHGIWINGEKATGNKVQRNRIGTNALGDQPVPNQKGDGVHLTGAPGNLIGGTEGQYTRNVISGNGANGVTLSGAGTKNNTVQGNFIGTNLAGDTAMGNDESGVAIEDAPNNLIGGATLDLLGAGNIISGNKAYGVHILGVAATGNTLEANQIGTDYIGGNALPNAKDGVFIDGAPDNVIGGDATGAGNLISGNGGNGILAIGAADRTRILGNLIGTGVLGQAQLTGNKSNMGSGIALDGVHSTIIGGTTTNVRNVVSGNKGHGILLTSTYRVLEMVSVQGNLIGVDISGQNALANEQDGVHLDEAAVQNDIGGNMPGEGNIISHNGSNGLYISAKHNTVRGNTIKANKANGILMTSIAEYNTIGGTDAGSRNIINGNGTGASRAVGQGNGVFVDGGKTNFTIGNVISGNAGHGVYLRRGGWNYVDQNRIGINEAGLSADPNRGDGVRIEGAIYCRVDKNIVSGNLGCGIRVMGEHAKGNDLTNNYIGTDLNGNTAVSNKGDGIYLEDSLESVVSENLISGNSGNGIHVAGRGGNGYKSNGLAMHDSLSRVFDNAIGTKLNRKEALANHGNGILVDPEFVHIAMSGRNVLAFNRGDGIRLTATTGLTPESTTSIFANEGLGIDIGGDGVTQNSPDDSVLDYPVITSAEYTVVNRQSYIMKFCYLIHVTGTAPKKTRLILYANSTTDPSGFGEGRIGLARIYADVTGQFSSTVLRFTENEPLPTTLADELILTTMAENLFISEFSPSILAKRVTDSDGDGVSDKQENAGTNNGDVNKDGIPDSNQGNVANLTLPKGQGNFLVSTSPEWGLTPIIPQAGTLPPLAGWAEQNNLGTLTWMPFESFANIQPGNPDVKKLDMNLDLTDLPNDGYIPGSESIHHTSSSTGYVANLLPSLVYWLYGPTSDNPDPHWYRFDYDGSTGATFSGTQMTLHFIDGDRGDDDLTINGQIHFQGVLAADRTADLSLAGTVTPDGSRIGERLTYILTVTNNGADDVPGVTLVDDLPGGVDLVSATATQGECTSEPAGVNCALGTLATGATNTVTLEIRPTSEGLFKNTAQLTAWAFDPDTTNNTVTLQSIVKPDLRDVILIFQILCRIDTTGFDLIRDRTGDGVINMQDAISLLQELASPKD